MGRRLKRMGFVNAPIAAIDVPADLREAGRAEAYELPAIGFGEPVRIAAIGGGRYRLLEGLPRLEAAIRAGGTHVPACLVFIMD